MKRLTGLFLAVSFFVWILPLGAFIKPTQEKTACAGRRAMHMCSMMSNGPSKKAPDGISFTAAGTFEKTAKPSSSGSGNEYLLASSEQAPPSSSEFFRTSHMTLKLERFVTPPTLPPKTLRLV